MTTTNYNFSPRKVFLPYRFYVYSILFLITLGIITTSYLCYLHYKNYTDITYSSFCAISNAINCDTVSQSTWSIFLGLPVSYWGLFGYLLLLTLLSNTTKLNPNNRSIWLIILLLSLVFSIVSIFLGYISATQIKALCVLCILTYCINLTLTVITWAARQRLTSSNNLPLNISAFLLMMFKKKKLIFSLLFLTLALLILKFQIPNYWQYQFSNPNLDGINTGITKDGNPWIGSDTAHLVINEYTDYKCFQCAKMHHMLRQLVSKYPDKIKLVHHQYPLDHDFNPIVVPRPFHIGSGKMALFAIYALDIGKFWQVNDALFELGKQGTPFSTTVLAEKTGLTSGEFVAATTSPKYRKILDRDIKKGMKLRITSTPTFVVNGRIYVGTIPTSILQIIMQ